MNKKQLQEDILNIHYKHPLAKQKITHSILTNLPLSEKDIIVMCIGTDRCTGDSLGPLVGSLFSINNPQILKVYGTLHQPIHATNLDSYMTYIKNSYDDPFVIAIDASLGRKSSIGSLITQTGPIMPGAAVNKQLPPVGDMHLIAVVNIYSLMNYSTLQSTRLSLIYDMAIVIVNSLTEVDRTLTSNI